ncbi:probable beta-1,4-xylosyltransferase IRX10 isoform X3 [Phragmites australis]|uniref:probable beta-1,4-xylosyltransferase IRX10 isoform X3 n=1 Tax=Phragmites australis TaxID=29695 RepID=UPI002D76B554|nr:probable beta-1,4-xylosyltransferase IRX10 isoform X3 [Phragmites australis]
MRQQHHACSRAHQVGALLLVAATFVLTRLFDRLLLPDTSASSSYSSSSFFGAADAALRIYVYAEGEIDGLRALLRGRDGTVPAATCLKGQWGTQVKIHQFLLNSRFRTLNKDEANLFFVPSYVKCVRMTGALSDKEINHTYVKVLSQMPYFRRSGGRDHIFVFPSGAGAHLFRSWSTFLNRSIILTPELESPELKLSGPNKLGRIDYFKHLRNAKFCLAPRGESSWTLRFYESFFVECVPVILSDEVELPFQNVIDYSKISIKWPSSRIGPELLGYLESIPDERIEEMIGRGREMRCMWVYAVDAEPCSAMSGILWELQRKVRRFHQSPETFWLHNRSIVNRDLVEFHSWRSPVPLP